MLCAQGGHNHVENRQTGDRAGREQAGFGNGGHVTILPLAEKTVGDGMGKRRRCALCRSVRPVYCAPVPIGPLRDPRHCPGGLIAGRGQRLPNVFWRSEEHTSELQSLMRISYAVFCLKKKTTIKE